jgi:CubicO group peptidase (beta-lactamase class C family)
MCLASMRLAIPLTLLSASAAAQPRPLAGLDRYLEASMAAWQVPGLALAIVKDDSVVFARGYGVRQLGGTERVDESTVFAIGSAGKSFTTAALAMLVGRSSGRSPARVRARPGRADPGGSNPGPGDPPDRAAWGRPR